MSDSLLRNRWVSVFASAVGLFSANAGKPTQDCCGVRLLGEGVLAIAVSDGAGSAARAEIGSQTIVKQSLDFLESRAISAAPTESEWNSLAWSLVKRILEELRGRMPSDGASDISDYHATMIVIVASSEWLACIHVGDGRAGFRQSDGEWRALTVPSKGEYANETAFVTMLSDEQGEFADELQTVLRRTPVDAVVATTDGGERAAFLTLQKVSDEPLMYEDLNTPFAGFLDPVIALLRESSSVTDTIEHPKNSSWAEFLRDGSSRHPALRDEEDDKTIVVATVVPDTP